MTEIDDDDWLIQFYFILFYILFLWSWCIIIFFFSPDHFTFFIFFPWKIVDDDFWYDRENCSHSLHCHQGREVSWNAQRSPESPRYQLEPSELGRWVLLLYILKIHLIQLVTSSSFCFLFFFWVVSGDDWSEISNYKLSVSGHFVQAWSHTLCVCSVYLCLISLFSSVPFGPPVFPLSLGVSFAYSQNMSFKYVL